MFSRKRFVRRKQQRKRKKGATVDAMDGTDRMKTRKTSEKRSKGTKDEPDYPFLGCYKHKKKRDEDFLLRIGEVEGRVLKRCFNRCEDPVVGIHKQSLNDEDNKVGCFCFPGGEDIGKEVGKRRCNRQCNLTEDQTCGGHNKMVSVYTIPHWRPTDQVTTAANYTVDGSNTGLIIGVTLGAVVVTVVVIIAVILFRRWMKGRKRGRRHSDASGTYDTIEYHGISTCTSGVSDTSCSAQLLNGSQTDGPTTANVRRQNTYLGHPRRLPDEPRNSEIEKLLRPPIPEESVDEMGYMEPRSVQLYTDVIGDEKKSLPLHRNPSDDIPDIPVTVAPLPPTQYYVIEKQERDRVLPDVPYVAEGIPVNGNTESDVNVKEADIKRADSKITKVSVTGEVRNNPENKLDLLTQNENSQEVNSQNADKSEESAKEGNKISEINEKNCSQTDDKSVHQNCNNTDKMRRVSSAEDTVQQGELTSLSSTDDFKSLESSVEIINCEIRLHTEELNSTEA